MKLPTLLGGDAGEAKADEPLDLDDLVAKLNAAETKIRGLVSGVVPKVNLALPRISASSLEPEVVVGSPAGAAFTALPQTAQVQDLPDVEVGGAGIARLAGGERLLEAEAQGGIEQMQGNVAALTFRAQGGLKQAQKHLSNLVCQLKAPLLAAISSLALVVAAALAGLGPAVAAVATAVASSVGFAFTLNARATSVRSKLLEQFDMAMEQVLQALAGAKDLLLGLSKNVLDAIDEMSEQQRPALEKVAELEKTLKIDVPDPGDLKKPLDSCEAKVAEFAREAEEQIPKKVNDLLRTMFIGKVVMDRQYFNGLVVVLPSVVVLAMNLSFAFAQLSFHFSRHRGAEEHEFGSPKGDALTDRRLGTSMSDLLPNQDIDWSDYVHPWLFQMALMALQVAGAMVITRASMLLSSANGALGKLEENANAGINERISAAVDQVLGAAFQQVTQQCDEFFPKFKEVLGKLQSALELAGKANRLRALF
mmetsp:Transcript_38880/g.123413  ORF Transcript_38880/g.123413 Transcript_38880/m.123413 type:complete len:479 (+) Transcript_38880:256-1692(+)